MGRECDAGACPCKISQRLSQALEIAGYGIPAVEYWVAPQRSSGGFLLGAILRTMMGGATILVAMAGVMPTSCPISEEWKPQTLGMIGFAAEVVGAK